MTINAITEQAIFKTEDGVRFPKAAYAFVPDPESSSTWKLRLWETPTKKETLRQLGRAAAAFSPGGFRGQRVQIPRDQISRVKARIRAAYRRLGVESEDVPASVREARGCRQDKFIPKWVEESSPMQRILGSSITPLEEKSFDPAKGELTITVIKPGFNTSKTRFYPAEMLRRDHAVFDGMKMFTNHQTETEKDARPERNIWHEAAFLDRTWTEEDGTVKGIARIANPQFHELMEYRAKQGLLSQTATSIVALGEGIKTTIEGTATKLVERLIKGRSVDFVTYAGAGGRVECMEDDSEALANDVDLIDEEGLRQRRPDLIEIIERAKEAASIEANAKPKEEADDMSEELKMQLEVAEKRLKDVEENLTTMTTERDELKTQAEEAQRAEAKAEVQNKVSEAVANAKELPEPARKRLVQQFADAESADGIEDAIEAERKYLADLTGSGTVTGLGGSEIEESADDGSTEFYASMVRKYQRSGKSKEDAERMAEVAAGR